MEGHHVLKRNCLQNILKLHSPPQKTRTWWILLKQETVSGNGISWAICKSAPRSRQITMPAPHYSAFYRLDALPVAQPTASKHWRHILHEHAAFKLWIRPESCGLVSCPAPACRGSVRTCTWVESVSRSCRPRGTERFLQWSRTPPLDARPLLPTTPSNSDHILKNIFFGYKWNTIIMGPLFIHNTQVCPSPQKTRDVMEPGKIHFVGFCVSNPSDSDDDLPHDHSMFHWIAIYWCLHVLNTKSDDISRSYSAFNIIRTSRNSYSMCICLFMRSKRPTAMNDEWELYATNESSESEVNESVNPSHFGFA